ALLVSLLLREGPLLVVAGPDAVSVYGLPELPSGPAELIELGQWPAPLEEHQHSGDELREVVADGRAPRDVHDRPAQGRGLVLAEEAHQAHRPGDVPRRRGYAPPSGTGADGDARGRAGRHPPDPVGDPQRLVIRARRLHRVRPIRPDAEPRE